MKKLLFFALCCASLAAEIYETGTIFSVDEYRDGDTLIIYDIDNTLIEPSQSLGSDQWFCHHLAEMKKEIPNEEKAIRKAVADWKVIQSHSVMKEVEMGTSEMIRRQQKEGALTMALTTRDMGFLDATLHQLNGLGIDFTHNPPSKNEAFFHNGDSVLFKNGVLFCANTHKGKAFQKLLKATGFHPKRVIFINDKRNNIAQLEETCIEMGIPFVGLRYGYTDEKVKNFNRHVTDLQHKRFFGDLLSDTEVLKILNHSH